FVLYSPSRLVYLVTGIVFIRLMDQNKGFRQVSLKSSSEASPRSSPSIFERIRTALSPSAESTQPPVKVRLINGWQDFTGENINTVVCNFLYDENSEHYERWQKVETISGLRREHFFYGMCFALFVMVVRQDPLAIMHSFVVLIGPAICTVLVLNDEQLEGARYWLQYWIVYAVITLLGRIFKRPPDDYSDLSWMEVIFFAACLIPASYLPDFIIACIMPLFNKAKLTFDEYNYQYVS
uniref:Transmembrane protein n=1 Tax=Haemonchus contortus TaxID=6289 RepID=A0A7I4Y7N6_HAECO